MIQRKKTLSMLYLYIIRGKRKLFCRLGKTIYLVKYNITRNKGKTKQRTHYDKFKKENHFRLSDWFVLYNYNINNGPKARNMTFCSFLIFSNQVTNRTFYLNAGVVKCGLVFVNLSDNVGLSVLENKLKLH